MAEAPSGPSANVRIPQELYDKIALMAKDADFPSVDSYVAFVLGEVIEDDDTAFSPEEEEKVKERLRNLGYL
jgi:hypothetical protein